MSTETLANYLNEKRLQAGLTYEALATMSNRPESTVKNLCMGKTEDPRLETIIPVVKAVGGSFDEMLFPEKTKDEIKETSLLALKDIYEFQLSKAKETNEEHVHNIRTHYEQHHEDLKENYEKIIDMQNKTIAKIEETHQAQVEKLEAQNKAKTKIIWALASVFFALFFGLIALEVMHPEHGWIRF